MLLQVAKLIQNPYEIQLFTKFIMSKEYSPNFKTKLEDYCKEEKNKLAFDSFAGNLSEDFRNLENKDVAWETEQLAKSHGIYLGFDRAKTGREKDFRYMIRITIPGGGPLTKEAWKILDDVAKKYTTGPRSEPSLRLTTRQNIQYHWIKKEDLISCVQDIVKSGFLTLNGCGDNTRNVMACPLSRYSKIFNANAWALKAANYFQLPEEPFIKVFEIDTSFLRQSQENQERFDYGKSLLNRKFKIAFSGVSLNDNGIYELDNCVEVRTNDLGIVPILENKKVVAFQIYVGGGQGERNGKPSIATLAKPICIVTEDKLLETMDAVVKVHKEWGDRENRHWARVKYVIKSQGTDWYREQMEEQLGYKLEKPNLDLDVGRRFLHHGWNKQESNDKWAFGTFIENGRISDESQNGKLREMFNSSFEKFNCQAVVTPNQDIIFTEIKEDAKEDFLANLESFGFGKRNGKVYSSLRLESGACVGRDTCRLTYTDSEKFEPELIDKLEEMGWGEMKESIGITGCERQCFRPSTKTIGLVGTGLDRYQLRLGGSADCRTQGSPIYSEDKTSSYLRSIPREEVPIVIDALFRFYQENKAENESMGSFNNRIGTEKIIKHLKENPNTNHLMDENKVKAYLEG